MLSLLSTLLVFRVISAVTALGLPHMARAADSTFNLYAYGDGIGGIPLLYSNGYAFVGNTSNADYFANVTFTPSSSDESSWMADPDSSNNTSTDLKLFIPSSSGQIGFTDTSGPKKKTSGFKLYGNTVFVVSDTEGWQTYFYAKPTEEDDVWSLVWNTNDSNKKHVPLALRTVAPANPKE